MKKALQQAIERDNYTCKRCGKHTQACPHHIKPRSRYPELKKDVNNMVTLCNTCHRWVHDNPKKAHEAGLLYVGKYDV